MAERERRRESESELAMEMEIVCIILFLCTIAPFLMGLLLCVLDIITSNWFQTVPIENMIWFSSRVIFSNAKRFVLCSSVAFGCIHISIQYIHLTYSSSLFNIDWLPWLSNFAIDCINLQVSIHFQLAHTKNDAVQFSSPRSRSNNRTF